MHLHQREGAQARGAQGLVGAEQAPSAHVGDRALVGGAAGQALRGAAGHQVQGVQVGDRPAPPGHGLHPAALAGEPELLGLKRPRDRVALVEADDHPLGLGGTHPAPSRQGARPLPGEGGEVDHLSELALVDAHRLGRGLEDRRRRLTVHVLAARQRLGERGIVGQVRQHVEPELAVVDRQQRPARRRHEGASDPGHVERPARHAAQVGVGVDQPAGEGARRVEGGADPVIGVDMLHQGDDPGVPQALEPAPPEHQGHQGMLVGEPLEGRVELTTVEFGQRYRVAGFALEVGR